MLVEAGVPSLRSTESWHCGGALWVCVEDTKDDIDAGREGWETSIGEVEVPALERETQTEGTEEAGLIICFPPLRIGGCPVMRGGEGRKGAVPRLFRFA